MFNLYLKAGWEADLDRDGEKRLDLGRIHGHVMDKQENGWEWEVWAFGQRREDGWAASEPEAKAKVEFEIRAMLLDN